MRVLARIVGVRNPRDGATVVELEVEAGGPTEAKRLLEWVALRGMGEREILLVPPDYAGWTYSDVLATLEALSAAGAKLTGSGGMSPANVVAMLVDRAGLP